MDDQVDIMEDASLKTLVDEYTEVEEEVNQPPEVSMEELETPKPEVAVDPDEPSRELPDDTPVAKETPSPPKETPVVDEITQQLVSLADEYGIDSDSLAGKFTSVDDARAALALLDQSYVADAQEIRRQEEEAYKQQQAAYEQQQAAQQPQESQQKEHQQTAETEPPKAAQQAPPPIWSELELDDWDDDDAIPKNLKGIDSNVNQLASYVEMLKNEVIKLTREKDYQSYDETMNRLNAIIDDKESTLFGSAVNLTQAQVDNRVKLLEQADVLVAGMRTRGVPLPGEGQLMDRAMRLAFGDKVEKERALGDPSVRRNKRRIGMPSRGTERSVADMAMQHSGPLEENEAFLQLYKRMEEESN